MKNNTNDYKDSIAHINLSKTREDKLLSWLAGEKQKEYKNTEKEKKDFIKEMKNYLGKEIKDSKNFQPKKIKISIFKRILKEISKIFDII